MRSPLLELIKQDSKDCSAQALYNSFKAALTKHNIPVKNIIGLASDNANVLVRAHNSFASRLAAECEGLVVLACICHSASICASNACAKLPASVGELLRNMSTYVSSSSKRSAFLMSFQEFYKQEQLKLIKPAQTR